MISIYEWGIMWCYQQRLNVVKMKDDFYSKWMLTKVYVISSMYSDGVSSLTGKEGTWDARRCHYTRTLTESTTMVGDINMILCYSLSMIQE